MKLFQNENQIRRLQNDLDEIIASKQDIVKSNYILVQNCESLREQLRMFVDKTSKKFDEILLLFSAHELKQQRFT